MQTLGSRQVYTNAWMSVREDDVRRFDGSPGIYGVVDKADYALIIPWMVIRCTWSSSTATR